MTTTPTAAVAGLLPTVGGALYDPATRHLYLMSTVRLDERGRQVEPVDSDERDYYEMLDAAIDRADALIADGHTPRRSVRRHRRPRPVRCGHGVAVQRPRPRAQPVTGDVHYEFRPLEAWPGTSTPWARRRSAPFKASYNDTLDLLFYELGRLDARDVLIRTFHQPADIRRDGLPKANARQPGHPGVVVSATTRKGDTFVWKTDACDRWEHNLRAVALGLEALRAVDRHGITAAGEQYAGFRQITVESGGPPTANPVVVLADAAGWDARQVAADPRGAYRAAAKQFHPDLRGDHAQWLHIDVAYRQLNGGDPT